jgi:hypothetical protein
VNTGSDGPVPISNDLHGSVTTCQWPNRHYTGKLSSSCHFVHMARLDRSRPIAATAATAADPCHAALASVSVNEWPAALKFKSFPEPDSLVRGFVEGSPICRRIALVHENT